MVTIISDIMITQKEMVDEILSLWQRGEHSLSRYLLKEYKQHISPKIYFYMYNKMGITKDKRIPALLKKAQVMMGGRIFDQYDTEWINPDIEVKKVYKKAKWKN